MQNALPIDVRKPEVVLRKITDATRRLEKGGSARSAAQELAAELFDAVADSGPLELGISPRSWLRAQAKAGSWKRTLRFAADADTPAVRRALADLRRIFRRGDWSRRWRRQFDNPKHGPWALFALGSGFLIGATWLGEALAHGQIAARWVLPGLLFAFIFFLITALARQRGLDAAVAREIAAAVVPRERWLCNMRMPRQHVVIATDQRLLIAIPARNRRGAEIVWSATYDDISSVGDSKMCLTVHSAEGPQTLERRDLAWLEDGDYQRSNQEALLAILRRRSRPPQ
jgi:hypothetical protein